MCALILYKYIIYKFIWTCLPTNAYTPRCRFECRVLKMRKKLIAAHKSKDFALTLGPGLARHSPLALPAHLEVPSPPLPFTIPFACPAAMKCATHSTFDSALGYLHSLFDAFLMRYQRERIAIILIADSRPHRAAIVIDAADRVSVEPESW